MDPVLLALLGIAAMFLLIALHVPVGVSLGLTGLAAFAFMNDLAPALTLFRTEPSGNLSNGELALIPLFLLMGGFATLAGLSADLYRMAYGLIGHWRGGLAVSTIFGCAGFGAVSGSSVATAATMAKVALPEMESRGYKPALATGSIAAGGTLGMLIPPSIVMVIYAVLTEQFVITLFVAALLPGLLAVVLHVLAVVVHVRLDEGAGPAGQRLNWADRIRLVLSAWRVFVLIAIVLGGIYGGIFTVSEAAAVGVLVSAGFAFIAGRCRWSELRPMLLETASGAAMIYVLVIGAAIFTYFVTTSGLPEALVSAIRDTGWSPTLIIISLLVMYLVLGAVFETISSMVITLPFVFPLVTNLGYDPIWWGIMMVMVIEIGMITPPIGLNVFVIKGVAQDVPLGTIFKGITPFLVADISRLGLLLAFPAIALWLPSVLKV